MSDLPAFHTVTSPWRAWGGALVFGLLVYLCTAGAMPPDAELAQQLILAKLFIAASSLLLLAGTPRPYIDSGIRWLLIALLVAMAVSTFGAPRWPLALDRLLLYYGLALLGFAIFLWQRATPVDLAPYLVAIGVVHALVLVDVVFWLVMVQRGDASAAHMPHFGNVRHFGYLGYLAAAAGAALVLQSHRLALTGVLLGAAALFGIVQLGSRGAFVAWLVFVAAMLWPAGHRLRFLLHAGLALALAAGVSLLLQTQGLLTSKHLWARARLGNIASTNDRLELWLDALRGIAAHPWFGWGPDGHIASQCCPGRGLYLANTAQAHNFVLQSLEEFGLVGTLLLLALALRLLRRAPRPWRWRESAEQHTGVRALIALLTGYAAFGLVDGVFYYPVPLMQFAVWSGLLFAATARARELAQNQPDDQNRGF